MSDPPRPLPSKPKGKKRALLISIRHVEGKPGSSFSDLANLPLAHRDAKELRDTLIVSHGYKEDDVILMMDDKALPGYLWPTQRRILQQIDRLTSGAPENCHFIFYYSGHGVEVEADSDDRASMRTDGLEDEIVCADGKPILDYILHDRLITPLQKLKGSKLFVLLDCCHSETLLDLQRGSGPNHYSRVWNVGPGQMFKDLTTVIINLFKLSKRYCGKGNNVWIPLPPRRAGSKLRGPPTYKAKEVGELDVICLSACRDRESTHDDCQLGLTFTKWSYFHYHDILGLTMLPTLKCFLNAMVKKPNITWAELRDALTEFISEIRDGYEAYMQDAESGSSNETHRSWTQRPRICTGSHTDLTQPVNLMLQSPTSPQHDT